MATDGQNRILEKQPTELHERTPLICGASRDVRHIMSMIQGSATAPGVRSAPTTTLGHAPAM